MGPVPILTDSKIAFYYFIVSPPSAVQVATIKGLENLGTLPGIDEVRLNRQPGDAVDSRESTHQGHVIRIDGMVGSHPELFELIDRRIPSTVRLTWNFSDT
jgi:hypothetical protein